MHQVVRQRPYIALALVMTMLSASCGSGGTGLGVNLISLEEEWQLGNQLAADIARQMRVTEDPYVTRLGQRIVAQSDMKNLPWQFHVVDDPSINAFNIPGGHVYVNRGLIAASANASELAGVMAHEISHGVKRHSTQQLSNQYGLSLLASLVLGQNPATYQAILAQVIGAGTLARFSREAEEESDELGLKLMVGAGYHPEGMVTMFQKLLAERRSRPSGVEQFFATHPLTEDRISNVQREIRGMSLPANLVRDEAEFIALKSRSTR